MQMGMRTVKIYNTMTNKKEEFVPLEEGKVKIYACGPTVYDYFHLGNARPFVTFDTLRRFLEYIGYQVTFVQNFTDIDDKLIRRAEREQTTVQAIADRFIKEYFVDAKGLNIRPADYHPRATESMAAILELIKSLMDKGYAYQAADGIYFRTEQFKEYGKLSGHHIEDLLAGASHRVGTGDHKENPLDFALWKFKKEGEPAWDSPWGEGRPGWHIECSAMVKQYLGDTIDIHGGGQDLVFPHHENEIAQSECAHDKTFANYWMHNGFINVDHVKMSKSLGNFFTVRDIVDHYPYPVIRYFLLTGHYRTPINFSDSQLTEAATAYRRIETCVDNLTFYIKNTDRGEQEAADRAVQENCDRAKERFVKALSDDLNTADALGAIFDLVRLLNQAIADADISAGAAERGRNCLLELCDVLGLEPGAKQTMSIPAEIMDLVTARTKAKAEKDFAAADALRNQVEAAGYRIEDTAEGPHVLPL